MSVVTFLPLARNGSIRIIITLSETRYQLDTCLVWFLCTAENCTFLTLVQEEPFIGGDVSTRVGGLDTVADKWFPQVRHGSKLFVCARSRPVNMSVMQDVLEAVPVHGSSGQLVPSAVKMMAAINAMSSGKAMDHCSTVCRACWTVHSWIMRRMSIAIKVRKLWMRLVTVLRVLAVGSPYAADGSLGVKWSRVPTRSLRHTVPSFIISVRSVSTRGRLAGKEVSSSVGWNLNCEQ